MSIRGTVGFYVVERRQAENYLADQKTVTGLLNRIPLLDGGQEGRLTPPVTDRKCYKDLADAIVAFERYNFNKVTGVVEPRSLMLAKMEELAYEATKKAGGDPLDVLQDSLTDIRTTYRPPAGENWSAGDRVKRDVLAREAWEYIESLERYLREHRSPAAKELPFAGFLFGNAIISLPGTHNGRVGVPSRGYQRAEIRHRGTPITNNCEIETTEDDGPALVLFKNCTGIFLPSGTHLDWRDLLDRDAFERRSSKQPVVVLPDDNWTKVSAG
ncbi:MAG: hypothetical protein ACJ8D0_04985 [Xanthobacteraceae bacterium]